MLKYLAPTSDRGHCFSSDMTNLLVLLRQIIALNSENSKKLHKYIYLGRNAQFLNDKHLVLVNNSDNHVCSFHFPVSSDGELAKQ
jgi:hypothetical protein